MAWYGWGMTTNRYPCPWCKRMADWHEDRTDRLVFEWSLHKCPPGTYVWSDDVEERVLN